MAEFRLPASEAQLRELAAAEEIQAPTAQPDEKHAEDVAHGASPHCNRLGEESDPEPDRDEPERKNGPPVETRHAARSRGVATMTRHGA